ncbi:SAWADEE HOMEODOMAIN 2-like protein [Trifolium pratense]|uniref:SAWADEE HOMEODOMAIN 2-like protein n=1 Tax=Trifolium pratense TaxID=57577 RepID=A0A2K3LPS3_TRIPR|nr:SAWADEE HOMEODOMAIN 2-like protein [Trifolium pratense]
MFALGHTIYWAGPEHFFDVFCYFTYSVVLQEIVPLRKVCRRPETDYRLHQLHAVNDAAPADQQKISLDHPTNVHGIRVISSSETVQKQQQQIANIHIVTPVLQTNVSIPKPPPQSMNVDPMKAETKADVQAGISVPPGFAPLAVPPGFAPLAAGIITTGSITSSIIPEVSTQNKAEGK